MHKLLTKRSIFFIIATLLVVTLITTLIILSRVSDTRSRAADTDWIQVGSHPHASVEYTLANKSLGTMSAWNFKLYTGFGYWNTHQGPIAIDSFDPVTKTFSYDGLLYTETLTHFRPSYGKLYVPTFNAMHTDRMETFNYTEPGKPWTEIGNLNLSYARDMVSLTGKDLFYIGSSHNTYDVDYSSDGGVSWQLDVIPGTQGHLAVYKNKLYVRGPTTTKVFNGTTWSDNPVDLGSMTEPKIFKDKLVYLNGGRLKSFDGTTVTTVNPNSLARYTISGNKIYIMTAGITKNVYTSTDLTNWTLLTTFTNPQSSSMAVTNGKLYIGTTDSKIYEFITPVSTLPEVIIYSNDDDLSENSNSGSIIVKRNGSTTSPLTINYTVSGTATNGADYVSLPGSITIPSGSTQTTINVNSIQDGVPNEGNETIILTLQSTSLYDAVEPINTILTIYEKPAVYSEIVDDKASESNNPASLKLTRKGDLSNPLTVNLNFANQIDLNGRIGPIATVNTDYTMSSTVTIPAGEKSAIVNLNAIEDTLYEADEWVRIEVLTNASYVRELPSRQLIKIEDNDTPTSPNLILNPDFEIDVASPLGTPDNWSGGNGDKNEFHSGTTSITASGPTAELAISYHRQTVPIVGGKTYIFSGWIKTDGEVTGRGPTIRVGPSAQFYTPWVRDSKGTWQFVSNRFTADPTWTSIIFDISWVINGAQKAWFDNIALREEITTPPTPTVTPSITITPTNTPTPTVTLTPTPTISSTPSTTPSSTQKVGDFNSDTIVDLLDFNIWRNEFLTPTITRASDANKDNIIDLLDFNIWLNAFRAQ